MRCSVGKMLCKVITYSIAAASVVTAGASERMPSSIDAIRRAIEHPDAETTKNWLKSECDGGFNTSVLFPQSTDSKYAVVEASSDDCGTMPLVLFKSVDGAAWTYSDTIHLSSHYGTQPDIRLVDFAQKGLSDVLVQHEIVDWGTGVLQKDISVYHVSGGQLRCVLEEPESVHFAPRPGTSTVEQQSKFDVRESAPDNVGGTKYLHEERQIKIGKQTFRRYRACYWEEKNQHFLCVESGD